MSEDVEIGYDELVGELRELHGRVVAFELRDERNQVVAEGEGEFHDLSVDAPDGLSFEVGGVPDRLRDGIRFVSSSHTVIRVDALTGARRVDPGIGAVTLGAKTAAGLQIEVWPAMPPLQQYTEMHDDNR
jgi:hypothetical protein